MQAHFNYLGDKEKGRRLRLFALKQLHILKTHMDFQGLEQYSRLVKFDDGIVIKASRVFGYNTIDVFVPQTLPGVEKVVPQIEPKKEFVWVTPCAIWMDDSVYNRFYITKAVNGGWTVEHTFNINSTETLAQSIAAEDGVYYWGYNTDLGGGQNKVTMSSSKTGFLFSFLSRYYISSSADIRAIAIWRNVLYFAMRSGVTNTSSYLAAYTLTGALLWETTLEDTSADSLFIDVDDNGIVVLAVTSGVNEVLLNILALDGNVKKTINLSAEFGSYVSYGSNATTDGIFSAAGCTGYISSPFDIFVALLQYDSEGKAIGTISAYDTQGDPIDTGARTDHRKAGGGIYTLWGATLAERFGLAVFDRAANGTLAYVETIPPYNASLQSVILMHGFFTKKQPHVNTLFPK